MALVPNEAIQRHIDLINEYHEDAFQQNITWVKNNVNVDKHGEDYNQRPEQVVLKGLVQYNEFRSWPITQMTDSGEIDKQSCMVYFNTDYLKGLDLVNEHDQFVLNPDYDRFILAGKVYKPMGESQTAQIKNRILFTFIVLKREETSTGTPLY